MSPIGWEDPALAVGEKLCRPSHAIGSQSRRNQPPSPSFSRHEENSRRKLQHGPAGGRREPTGALAQPRSADQPIINVSDQPQVRIIGAPFIPNTNPRER
jgi:hypothetical protein